MAGGSAGESCAGPNRGSGTDTSTGPAGRRDRVGPGNDVQERPGRGPGKGGTDLRNVSCLVSTGHRILSSLGSVSHYP